MSKKIYIESAWQDLPDNIQVANSIGKQSYKDIFKAMAKAISQVPANVCVWNSPWSYGITDKRERFFEALSNFAHENPAYGDEILIHGVKNPKEFRVKLRQEFNCLARAAKFDEEQRKQLSLWEGEQVKNFSAAHSLLGRTHDLNLEIRLAETAFVKGTKPVDNEHVDLGDLQGKAVPIKLSFNRLKGQVLRFACTDYGPGTFFADRKDLKQYKSSYGRWIFDGYKLKSIFIKPKHYHMRTGAIALFTADDWPYCAPAVHGIPEALRAENPEKRIVSIINCVPH